jgi:hypothetical protein
VGVEESEQSTDVEFKDAVQKDLLSDSNHARFKCLIVNNLGGKPE